MHDHAATETAPGHATLWSGRYPSHTGVVINDIGVSDPQEPLVAGRGGGASPYRFRGSSIFDWVRARDQFSRALSVSRKDRGAILPLGRSKQSVYWYGLDGRFTTSRYYADTLPTSDDTAATYHEQTVTTYGQPAVVVRPAEPAVTYREHTVTRYDDPAVVERSAPA